MSDRTDRCLKLNVLLRFDICLEIERREPGRQGPTANHYSTEGSNYSTIRLYSYRAVVRESRIRTIAVSFACLHIPARLSSKLRTMCQCLRRSESNLAVHHTGCPTTVQQADMYTCDHDPNCKCTQMSYCRPMRSTPSFILPIRFRTPPRSPSTGVLAPLFPPVR